MNINLDSLDYQWIANRKYDRPWQIQKERRLVCFGNPGYVMQWDYCDSFATEEEAKKELERLNSRLDPTSHSRYQIVDTRGHTWTVKA